MGLYKKIVVPDSDVSFNSVISPIITGSLFGSASWATNALTASSADTFLIRNGLTVTGSINITGSTTQTGDNILIGNTQLSGSINISGSNIIQGITTITGSLFITGSTTQIGNNNLFGNTTLSGSIIISGSIIDPTIQIYGNTQHDGYVRFNPVSTNLNNSISASYIYVSGSTNDLYFTQNGQGYTNTTRLRWLEGNLYTGLLHGGLITTQSSTIFQISSGSGIIVNLNASIPNDPYPTIQFVQWPNLSSSIAPLSASYDQQFVAISSSGQIYAQGTPFTDGDFNNKITIGVVLHQNRSTINAVQTFPNVAYGWKQRSFDFIKAFGPLKISGYNLIPSSSLGLLLSGGTAFVEGRNYTLNPNSPDYIVETNGITTSKIFYYHQSGSGWVYDTNNGVGYSNITASLYSNNGVLTPVGSNNWSIQRVFYFPNSATKAFYVYFGNASYANKTDAIAAIQTEPFTEAPNTATNAIFVGYMLLRNNANFTTAASYEFRAGGLFRGVGGGGGGGGGGTTSLSALTDVSLISPSYGDLLMYDSTYWYNTKVLSGSYTLSGSLTTNDGVSVQTLTASVVSASQITGSLFGTSSYATTASYALNGGVTQITAGTGVSINQSTGNVTISTTGGTGGICNNPDWYIVNISQTGPEPPVVNYVGCNQFNDKYGTDLTWTYLDYGTYQLIDQNNMGVLIPGNIMILATMGTSTATSKVKSIIYDHIDANTITFYTYDGQVSDLADGILKWATIELKAYYICRTYTITIDWGETGQPAGNPVVIDYVDCNVVAQQLSLDAYGTGIQTYTYCSVVVPTVYINPNPVPVTIVDDGSCNP